ncbi:Zn ribbon [Haloarcula virus HVTV-2]|uniref:Small CPxCG-related zinc finger protein n=1 Tax=Haloarcula vallismortis tailed virus 1 TaxID=1262528 RepID=L7TJ53_9CAUD|nr:hypothetical protein HVTV1_48 [Haloarcula vallismortis tailed virus 1]AGC34418.1 hypothetical protein HVTV1_48 [Haloarcula vallismortis tailed virus 1]UBF22855.1 Zn ribbon [Haloarcula virus HVTV-2]
MPECQGCDGHVSAEFARVMGDNDGVVHACPDCSTNTVGEEAGGLSTSDGI